MFRKSLAVLRQKISYIFLFLFSAILSCLGHYTEIELTLVQSACISGKEKRED
jgi:hypothetical protein